MDGRLRFEDDEISSGRRRFLTALGVGVTGGLAGCSSDDSGSGADPTPTSTPEDTTPTETATATETATQSEPEEFSLIYNNVSDGDVLRDTEVQAEVSPSEEAGELIFGITPVTDFQDVENLLEDDRTLQVNGTDQIPENGKVKFTFPWMETLYTQTEQMKQESSQDNPYVWPEAGGEQTLLAVAKPTGQNYKDTFETVPVTLQHPRDQLNLQAHNQRTTNMWNHLPAYEREEYTRQQVFDIELLRQIAGPIIDENLEEEFSYDSRPRMNTEEEPSLESDKIYGKANFGYIFTTGKRIGNKASFYFMEQDNSAEEVIEDQFDFERVQETGGEEFEVFSYESDGFAAEMTYDPDRQALVWSSNGANENRLDRPVAFDKALELLTGNIESIGEQDNFTDRQEYNSKFYPLVGYNHTPDQLSKEADGRGNLVMLGWDTDNEIAYETVKDAETFELVDGPFERGDSNYLWGQF